MTDLPAYQQTNRPTDRPTEGQDRIGHNEVTHNVASLKMI